MQPDAIIRNDRFCSQIIDFGGMRFGRVRPTNIDASLDFGGRLFVLIEAKYGNASMPYGQLWHFSKICVSHRDAGHHAIAFAVCHYAEPGERVQLADAIVTMEFDPSDDDTQWHRRYAGLTARNAVDRFLSKHVHVVPNPSDYGLGAA